MQYINDLRHLVRDREDMESGRIGARKPNTHFRASRAVSRGDSRKHELVQVGALRNIKAAEKLFVDYGENVMF